MLTYSQAFNDAIRATDRQMYGLIRMPHYGQFSVDSVIGASDGLASFTVTRTAMAEDRFCVGSTTSAIAEINLLNVSAKLANSIKTSVFELYVGVKVGAETTLFSGSVDFGNSGLAQSSFSAASDILKTVSDDTLMSVAIDNDELPIGVWSLLGGFATSGNTYIYRLQSAFQNYPYVFKADGVTGSHNVTIKNLGYQVKCIGTFNGIKLENLGNGNYRITAADVVGLMGQYYLPSITPTSSGYQVLDVLNDIVDQTGINGGAHYTTEGSGIYVETLANGTYRDQFNWLMTLVDSYGSVYSGTVEPHPQRVNGYVVGKSYNGGAGTYTSYPAIDESVIYMDGISLNADNNYTISCIVTGTDDNKIILGSGAGIVRFYNPYIDLTHATDIFNNLNGVTYKPMTLHFRGDPCIELMDSLKVTRESTDYRCIAMKITSTFNGGFEQTIESFGERDEYYDSTTSPIGTITGAGGNISATTVQTGILRDAKGKNSWNLDTGALVITDGSINITTDSASFDVIELKNSDWTAKMSPLEFTVINSGTNNAFRLQAGTLYGYTGYDTPSQSLDLQLVSNGTLHGRYIFIYDGSSTYWRTRLTPNGLTFHDASGTETATYPASSSFTAPSVYSTRMTNISGGICQIGSMVVVNMTFTGNYTATNSPRIGSFSLLPKYVSALSCIDITNGISSSITESIPCGINTNGNIYIKKMTSGNIYAMTGIYSL